MAELKKHRSRNSPIEDRSDQYDVTLKEMLGRPPSWLHRYGLLSIGGVLLLLLIISIFIKYPDTLEGQALITTDPLPVVVVMPRNGVISKLYVSEGDTVTVGTELLELKDELSSQEVNELRNLLEYASMSYKKNPMQVLARLNQNTPLLGSAQQTYNKLISDLTDYSILQRSQIHDRRSQNLTNQLNKHSDYQNASRRSYEVNKQSNRNARKTYQKYQKLYKEKVISEKEFFEEEAKYHQSLIASEEYNKQLKQNELTRAEYQKQISDIEFEKQQQTLSLQASIADDIRALRSYIQTWEHQNTLIADIAGTVAYFEKTVPNSSYTSGDRLLAIIPSEHRSYAQVTLPAQGIAKIHPKQKVQFMLDQYPREEYGYIEGLVRRVSPLSIKSSTESQETYKFTVEVLVPKTYITSYGIVINPLPEATGTARIITEDYSFFQRIVNSLRKKLD